MFHIRMIYSRLVFVPAGGGETIGLHNYLFGKGIAINRSIIFYIMWIKKGLEFLNSSIYKDAKIGNINYFIRGLSKDSPDR